jgi:hypothetical protein
MEALSNFFALRPTFTFRGLRFVWYIYLLNIVIQFYVSVSEAATVMTQRGIAWQTWVPNLLPVILGVVAQVALVRLLIEVAATVLLGSRRGET